MALMGAVGMCSGGRASSNLMALLSHLITHRPQPMQCSLMIYAFIFLAFGVFRISMASKWQRSTQVWQPEQASWSMTARYRLGASVFHTSPKYLSEWSTMQQQGQQL